MGFGLVCGLAGANECASARALIDLVTDPKLVLLRLLAAASLVRLWLLRGAGDSQIGLSLNMEKKLFSFTQ